MGISLTMVRNHIWCTNLYLGGTECNVWECKYGLFLMRNGSYRVQNEIFYEIRFVTTIFRHLKALQLSHVYEPRALGLTMFKGKAASPTGRNSISDSNEVEKLALTSHKSTWAPLVFVSRFLSAQWHLRWITDSILMFLVFGAMLFFQEGTVWSSSGTHQLPRQFQIVCVDIDRYSRTRVV